DKDRLSGEILGNTEGLEDGGDNGFVFGEATGTGHTAGEVAAAGIDDANAALTQDFEIRLRRGVVPHVDVHGGSDDDGGGGGEVKSRKKIVGNALRKL